MATYLYVAIAVWSDMGVLDDFGISPEELSWDQLAACANIPLEEFVPQADDESGKPGHPFFEGYESDDNIARAIDSMCNSCPVQRFCYEYGVKNKEEGVWGGVYMVGGRMVASKNSHKSPADWEALKQKLGRIK